MTAVTLFDALAQVRASGTGGGALPDPLNWVSERLVADAFADLQRLQRYEQECLTHDWGGDAELHRSVTQSIYGMFQNWLTETGQVLDRVRQPDAGRTAVLGVAELDDAVCRVRARLNLTPDMVDRATGQVRRGETIPAEVLRDELRSRLRA